MAKRNHDLDSKIEEAAIQDFLEYGFNGASLRRIAASADVTIGALYTRYKTKDILFCSLVNPLVEKIQETFATLKTVYEKDTAADEKGGLLLGVQTETEAVLRLLFDDYTGAKLLLCRSEGSSLSSFFKLLVEKKTEETEKFFAHAGGKKPNMEAVRLLISSEFHALAEIINEGYTEEEAKNIAETVMAYRMGGWSAIL